MTDFSGEERFIDIFPLFEVLMAPDDRVNNADKNEAIAKSRQSLLTSLSDFHRRSGEVLTTNDVNKIWLKNFIYPTVDEFKTLFFNDKDSQEKLTSLVIKVFLAGTQIVDPSTIDQKSALFSERYSDSYSEIMTGKLSDQDEKFEKMIWNILQSGYGFKKSLEDGTYTPGDPISL